MAFGDPSIPTGVAARTLAGQMPPGSVPSGTYTGVPTYTTLGIRQVGSMQPVQIVNQGRENRFVTLTAPAVAFGIYIGDRGVSAGQGLRLTPGLPYEIALPGNQELWAISDAAGIYLQLQIQVAIALLGERERRL
jgi:hypothetical protein